MQIVVEQAKEDNILEKDPDNVLRFPAYYDVICVDNLDTIDALTPEDETKRLTADKVSSRKPRATLEGFMENGLLQNELEQLMSYFGLFKPAIYVRTAPASRWNMPQEVDKIADEIVKRATKHKVISIKGEWFWNSIVHFATAKTNRWHHQHAGAYNGRFLHYHWDRFIFRIISSTKACIVHPATLDSICDKEAYENIYKDIKRDEALDGLPQSSGGTGGTIDPKVDEDIAPDVLAASASYSAISVHLMNLGGSRRL